MRTCHRRGPVLGDARARAGAGTRAGASGQRRSCVAAEGAGPVAMTTALRTPPVG